MAWGGALLDSDDHHRMLRIDAKGRKDKVLYDLYGNENKDRREVQSTHGGYDASHRSHDGLG